MDTHRSACAELLRELSAHLQPGESIPLGALLDHFGHRAHGILLLVATLPSLLPVPLGLGAVLGPIVLVLGVGVALGLQRPWLPGWLRRRELSAELVAASVRKVEPWLLKLERWSRPRRLWLTDGVGGRVAGMVLIVLAAAFTLPVPLTNYPIGVAMILISAALIENDGTLLLWAYGYTLLMAAALILVWGGAVAAAVLALLPA